MILQKPILKFKKIQIQIRMGLKIISSGYGVTGDVAKI